jgi:hypothetical protein
MQKKERITFPPWHFVVITNGVNKADMHVDN